MVLEWSRNEIMHTAIGGGICFLLMFVLTSIINIIEFGFYQILKYFGILGIVIFESYSIIRLAMILVPVYFISGFAGGLYTGYFAEREDINIKLTITGSIGFIGFLLLVLIFGNLNLLTSKYLEMLVLPVLGNIVGAYLGGYTIKKPSEGGEEVEKLSFKVHLEK